MNKKVCSSRAFTNAHFKSKQAIFLKISHAFPHDATVKIKAVFPAVKCAQGFLPHFRRKAGQILFGNVGWIGNDEIKLAAFRHLFKKIGYDDFTAVRDAQILGILPCDRNSPF